MKATPVILLAAVLAAGCTKAAPTSPTLVDTSTVADAVKLDAKTSVQKVHLYFYDDDLNYSANTHIVGLHVEVADASAQDIVLAEGETGNQGDVSFWISSSVSSIAVTNGDNGLDGTVPECYVVAIKILNLPLRARESSIHIFESGKTYPACGE